MWMTGGGSLELLVSLLLGPPHGGKRRSSGYASGLPIRRGPHSEEEIAAGDGFKWAGCPASSVIVLEVLSIVCLLCQADGNSV